MTTTLSDSNIALLLPELAWRSAWDAATGAIEEYAAAVPSRRVAPNVTPNEIRDALDAWDFAAPRPPEDVVRFAADGLTRWQTHTGHPSYWGLYVPAPTSMGIVADALAAAFNPQLANWTHAPFPIELEQHVLRAVSSRFGYDATSIDATFTSGGAEANHTALLSALAAAAPDSRALGVRAFSRWPAVYVSADAHHSWVKAARASGLGDAAVRWVDAPHGRTNVEALERLLEGDRETHQPVLIVATAGTTSAGTIDPLKAIAAVAARYGAWFHVDAAWAGALIASDRLRHHLDGVELADSITFDAHKWLSVPMGAGIYTSRRRGTLAAAFDVATGYMPAAPVGPPTTDPYRTSLQWSRRFIGLKVFMTLATAGWPGVARAVEHQVALGRELKRALAADGWPSVNRTELPVACVIDERAPGGAQARYLEAIAAAMIDEGSAWTSIARLAGQGAALRCCVSNLRSSVDDVGDLIAALARARRRVSLEGCG
jgi:aromatic-L-amino-acid decarboxylase